MKKIVTDSESDEKIEQSDGKKIGILKLLQ